jgi:hypothetical protein
MTIIYCKKDWRDAFANYFNSQVAEMQAQLLKAGIASFGYFLVCLALLQPQAVTIAPEQPTVSSRPKTTVLGTTFEVNPLFDDAIDKVIANTRNLIRTQKKNHKLVAYVSIPLSATGGGYRPLNVEASRFVKRSLEDRYGADHFWALAPGETENELPSIGGQQPRGGEYLYMWTEILAGEKGTGDDFDMVYFAGPSDFARYLALPEKGEIDALVRYVDERAKQDAAFKAAIADVPKNRLDFLRYYAIRACSAYSSGAHDEWNVFVKVNKRRSSTIGVGFGNQIAMFFNGHPITPADMEREIAAGYEQTHELYPGSYKAWVNNFEGR